MGYHIPNKNEKTYNFDKIGTSIKLSELNGTIVPHIASAILDEDDVDKDPVKLGINNGILLTLTAFLAEGMSDIVDHPKFENCVYQALSRVPSLTALVTHDCNN